MQRKKKIEAVQNDQASIRHANAGALGTLPEEALCLVGGYLPLRGIRSLRMTCRFFQGHENLKNIMRENLSVRGLAGRFNTLILLNDRRVFVRGLNRCGQLGTFKQLTLPKGGAKGASVEQIAAGGFHTLILLNDGTMFGCGSNCSGQLGLGNSKRHYQKTLTLFPLPEEGMLVEQIAAGGHHTVILLNDGRVFVCGGNDYGQLGLGDRIDRHTLTQLSLPEGASVKQIVGGYGCTLILLKDDRMLGCGLNLDRNDTNTLTPLPLPKGASVKQIVTVGDAAKIIIWLDDGRVLNCGTEKLGQGDTNARDAWMQLPFPEGTSVKRIVEGHSPLICLNDGRVLNCGVAYRGGYCALRLYVSPNVVEEIAKQEENRNEKRCVLQ